MASLCVTPFTTQLGVNEENEMGDFQNGVLAGCLATLAAISFYEWWTSK
jgi:hypothetical protein